MKVKRGRRNSRDVKCRSSPLKVLQLKSLHNIFGEIFQNLVRNVEKRIDEDTMNDASVTCGG
jgi:hypothetical protein